MTTGNKFSLILTLVALGLLIPGITLPILQISITANFPIVGNFGIYESTQSIWQSIVTLYEENNYLVAFLILFFSIFVPISKAILILALILVKHLPNKQFINEFVNIISKWSMADVFVVSVLIVFLGTQSNNNINAYIHEGFYYFLNYCIFSMVAIQVFKLENQNEDMNNTNSESG